MKDLKSILKECSIKEIYCDNHGAPITYVIPIYQRNYAWERDEICALIKMSMILWIWAKRFIT